MQCPYLSNENECIKMLEEKLIEDLTDFDLKHFCKGNPAYCYYFREPHKNDYQTHSTSIDINKSLNNDEQFPLKNNTLEIKCRHSPIE